MKKIKNIILFGLGLFFLLGAIAMVTEDIIATIFFGGISFICFYFSHFVKFLKNIVCNIKTNETITTKTALSNLKNLSTNLKTDNIHMKNLDLSNNHINDNKVSVHDESFGNWYISLSFGASKSNNFPQAVGLAKMAPKYIENNINGQIIYQAIYSEKPQEYLMFIKLYELVSNWKSCYVIINGMVVDRKIVQGLNYCYGDKCRTAKHDFCYGASYMTENIFGCHRLQVSACNHPLYQFYKHKGLNTYLFDREAFFDYISLNFQNYKLCPCFNEENIYKIINSIPDVISKTQYQKLTEGQTKAINMKID